MKQIMKFPIRARHTPDRITVYQAYNAAIGLPAAQAGTLDTPVFSKTRMTWIKPQFLWMMYRSGWGQKDKNQAVILEIEMTRGGFNHLLENACLSSFDSAVYDGKQTWQSDLAARPNRVQWDPDKDLNLQPMKRRAIQIGISAPFVPFYLEQAILSVTDITQKAHDIQVLVSAGKVDEATALLPKETEIASDWHK